MEGDDHIHGTVRSIAVDISQLEMQFVITVFLCRLIAVVNDSGLQIQAGDRHVHLPHLDQVVVEDEGEVGLAAAKVDDADGAVSGETVHFIVDQL